MAVFQQTLAGIAEGSRLPAAVNSVILFQGHWHI